MQNILGRIKKIKKKKNLLPNYQKDSQNNARLQRPLLHFIVAHITLPTTAGNDWLIYQLMEAH